MQLRQRVYQPEKDIKIRTFQSYDDLIQQFEFKNNLEVYPSNNPLLDTKNKDNFFIERQREIAWKLLAIATSPENFFVGSVASLSAYVWSKGKNFDAAWMKNMPDLNEGTMRNLRESCNFVVDLSSVHAEQPQEAHLKPSFSAIIEYEALIPKLDKAAPIRPRALQFMRHGFVPVERIFVSTGKTQAYEGTIYKKKTQIKLQKVS